MEVRVIAYIVALSSVLAVTASTDTLDLIRDAQKANVGRYPGGELKATLRWGQDGRISTHGYAETRLIWADDKLRADVLDWGDHNHEFRPEPGKAHQEYWIVERQRLVSYIPDIRRVLITSPTRLSPPTRILMSPAASWYGRFCGTGESWHEQLDPGRVWAADTKKTDAEYPVQSVTKKSTDLIEVVVQYPRYKANLRLVFSLAADGNAVEYELKEPSPERIVSGVCEWQRDDQGRLHLAKRRQEQVFVDSKTKSYLEYTLLTFNPDYIPDKKLFEIDSLHLPDGTSITDELTGRNRRIGDRPVPTVVNRLGEMIDVMRTRGFASEGRK
jgi:hypothetical protein